MALPIQNNRYSAALLRSQPLPSGAETEKERPSAFVASLAVLVLTSIAALLRIWNGTGPSLRLDEGFSLRTAASPLLPHGQTLSLFQVVATDVHPPGYFVLLHVWMQAFGAQLAVLRLPSEIAGALAVPALYLLATSLYGRSAGLFSALLGVFSPFWIWHSQEARMYSFLLLFTILSSYCFVLALRHNQRTAWMAYGATSLLAIYMQYYAFIVLLVHGLFLILHFREYSRRQVIAWFGVMAGMALCYLPWVITFLKYYRGASDPSLETPTLYTPLTMLSTFLFGYLTTPITSNVVAAWPLLVVVSLALGIFAAALSRRASYLWLLLLGPVVITFAVTLLLRPITSTRYLIIVTPALCILIAVTLSRLRGGVVNLLVAGVVAAILVTAWQVEEVSALNPQAEDYRAAVTYIESHLKPGDVVALDAYYNQDAFSYYSHINLPVYGLPSIPEPGNGTVKPATLSGIRKVVNSVIAGRSRLWVLYYLEGNYDPRNSVRRYLAYNTAGHVVVFGGPYQRNQTRYPQSFRSVQLIRYDLIPRPSAKFQIRPETIQILRAISQLSPVLREPFRSPFGQPGARSGAIGHVIAPAPAAFAWHFPAISSSVSSAVVTVTNPNKVPVVATIRAGRRSSRGIMLLPGNAVDIGVRKLGGMVTLPVSIRSTGNVFASRMVVRGSSATVENGLHGIGP